LVVRNFIQLTVLIIKLFLFAYGIGSIFYIIGNFEYSYKDPTDELSNWLTEFEVYEKTNRESAVYVTYFALTTLTTVGFGDIYPTTSLERLVMCVVFVGGVSVYSVF
jgi:hypothetical protein